MSDIEVKRAAIMKAYDSDRWQEKVKKMPDAQVLAVYKKFLAEGRIR